MEQFELNEPWGQYINIEEDLQKPDIKKQYSKHITSSDVNARKYTPLLNSIREERQHIIDRDSIVTHNNRDNWNYKNFTFGNICLSVIRMYIYASSFYQSAYKKN
jgi:hypothetical protein